jgi:hypothetical protein
MITPPPGVRVYLACGYTDMRNDVVFIVMQSRPRQRYDCRGNALRITYHNYSSPCLPATWLTVYRAGESHLEFA